MLTETLVTREDVLQQYSTDKINQQRNARKYWKAMQLRVEQGYGAMRISQTINMPMGAVAYWLQGFEPKSIKGLTQLKNAGLLPFKPAETDTMKLFLRVLGLRYSDGCIYEQKRNNSITCYVCFG